MKRGLQEPTLPPATRPRLGDDNVIAKHYSDRSNQTVEEREASPIIHLKKLNNWIKSVLVQSYTKRGDAVLDIACGKGGDLIKWDKARVGYYVGIDIAEGSIEDARNRYNGDDSQNKKRNKFSFPARLMCADCFAIRIEDLLDDEAPFDVCSCQFALHYSWANEERARNALENVSAVLKDGGYFIGTIPDANVLVRKLRETEGLEFGNECYNVRFDDYYCEKKFPMSDPFGIRYEFHLEDAVNCPEWLVHFETLIAMASQCGLELFFKKNFHEFVHEHIKNPEFADLMRKLGALGNEYSKDTISRDEWDAAYIYLAFAFKKVGPSKLQAERTQKKPAPINQEEIIYFQ